MIESQNPLHPFSVEVTTTAASGSSTSRLIQSTAAPSPTPASGPNRNVEPDSTARRRPPRPPGRDGRGGQLGRAHPALPAISVTIPVFLSKYFLLTSLQPPSSEIVVSLATVGYGFDGSLAPSTVPGSTPCRAGRKPLLAKIFWPASSLLGSVRIAYQVAVAPVRSKAWSA